MPSAEDLIKKVINNNTVKVQIMTPELEKKFEEMEERQTEQHEETLQSQKKTEDAIKSSRGSDSSNFKEGGEMINKGIKGLTGVDIGGKFNDLKEKMGDLGNIFKGFGRLLKLQGLAEAGGASADFLSYGLQKDELSVTEKLKESIDKQTRLGEKERKSVVASRIQKEQPDNFRGIEEKLMTLSASEEDTAVIQEQFSDTFKKIADGDALGFDPLTGELSQDKTARKTFVEDITKTFEKKFNIDDEELLGEGFRENLEKNIKDFVENASRLAYELRSVDLNPEGQIEIDPSKDGFGGLRITPEGEFFENPKGVLEGLNEESIERFKTPFKQLGDEQKKSLLSDFNVKQDFIDSYNGDAQAAVDAISSNTVESVEVLRNTFAKSFEPLVQQENLGQELKQNKNVVSANVNDEQSQMMMNFLSNLPPILAVLKDQLDMDEDQKDKLFGGQKKTGSIVDKDGNPISSDDNSLGGSLKEQIGDAGKNYAEAILQGTAMGTASATAQKTFSGQKPTKTPPNKPGTTTPKGTGAAKAGGGIMGMLRGAAGGIVGFLGGTAGVVALGAALVGAGIYANTGNEKDNEDLGEGDSDYAKERKEKREQDIIELQGEDGYKKGESIVDINRMTGPGTDWGDFFTFGLRDDTIDFERLNQDDALLRLDQLMSADDLVGENLSEEQRKRLDQELRDAQTAAQKQLEDMQKESGERLSLEELQKYYDFEILGENMLKNIQPPQSVTDNSVINNNTTITSANPRQYDNDIDRAQGAVYT